MTKIVDVSALYKEQQELITAMYRTPLGTPEREEIVAKLDANVEMLLNVFGENTHCNKIDFEMFGLFSDLYKDRVGFRPRNEGWTYRRVKDWLDTDAKEGN